MTGILYDWAGSVIDKALDPDGHYGNQCVDTIDHFGQFIFGVPWQECVGGVNGAKDLFAVAPSKYWQKIAYYHGFIPQQFDVLVYAGDGLNQFGHTAVTWYASATAIDVIQQDGFAYPWQFVDGNYYSAKPAHYYKLHYSQAGTGPLLGVLRPRPEMLVQTGTITPAGSTKETELSADAVTKIIEHIDARIDNLATEGVSGGRNAGPLYDVARKVNNIDNALSEGVAGQRKAGSIFAALTELKTMADATGVDVTIDPKQFAQAVVAAMPKDLARQVVAAIGVALGDAA